MENLRIEREKGYPNSWIAGVDEVGRGCIAGPVVAAAVILPKDLKLSENPWLLEVNDSKALTSAKREFLTPKIQSWAQNYSVAWAEVHEIDLINIFHASYLAMKRAVEKLTLKPDHLLVDGNFRVTGLDHLAQTAVIKGDQHCLSIACASILAKVARDQWLVSMEGDYPGYGLGTHKGYPTAAHIKALDELGVSEIHRRSFAPVKSRLE